MLTSSPAPAAAPALFLEPYASRVARWLSPDIRAFAAAAAAFCKDAPVALRAYTDPLGKSVFYAGELDSEFNLCSVVKSNTVSTLPDGSLYSPDLAEAYLRSCDAKFWHAKAKRVVRIAQEKRELVAKAVGYGAGQMYSSAAAGVLCAADDVATARFLADSVVYDATSGKSTKLSDIVKTPAAQAAKIYSFISAIEELSAGARWAMLTITRPSVEHSNPKTSKKSHHWDGTTPDVAHSRISQSWARVRANLAKESVSLAGIRTEEPMGDATPHWHLGFFFKTPADLVKIRRAILREFGSGLRVNSPILDPVTGKLQFKAKGKLAVHSELHFSLADYDAGITRPVRSAALCQLDIGASPADLAPGDKVKRFSSYMLKYVAKNIAHELPDASDALASVVDTSNLIESGPARSVQEHRRTYGIRSIQFFGLPGYAQTAWDHLRMISLDSSIVPPHVAELAALCQLAKGAGAVPFLQKLGGLLPQASLARWEAKPMLDPVPHYTRYGKLTNRTVGISLSGFDASGCLLWSESYRIKTGSKQIMSSCAASALSSALASGDFGIRPAGDAARAAAGGLGQIGITVTAQTAQDLAIQAPVDLSHTISAAAASGKTTVLMGRVEFLVKSGVKPSKIVVTTFTRKAARELARRLPAACSGVQIGTMHSLATSWLCSGGAAVKLGYDALLDLSTRQGTRAFYLLLDEAQDCSPAQWAWAHAHAKTLFAVGDDRQALYSFRGAASGGLAAQASLTESVPDFFEPRVGVYDLATNFRSASAIVALANALTPAAVPSSALTFGGDVSVGIFQNRADELAALTDYVKSAAGSCAILCRTAAQVTFIKSRLSVLNLATPCSAFEHAEVLTVHAAKGLEYDNVAFASGARSAVELASVDFDCILYVAVTRARQNLFISSIGALPAQLSTALAAAF